MARTLIRGEASPVVRFGIRQFKDGTLRAASPCCNRSMETKYVTCKGCKKGYANVTLGDTWNLIGPLPVRSEESSYEWLREWAAGITGYDNLELTVKS